MSRGEWLENLARSALISRRFVIATGRIIIVARFVQHLICIRVAQKPVHADAYFDWSGHRREPFPLFARFIYVMPRVKPMNSQFTSMLQELRGQFGNVADIVG